MLESFFGFTGLPFGRNVDAACLMRTEAWDEMDERLRHVARTVGFGVFTGDTGTGKTTALRRFAQDLDARKHRVLYVCDSFLTPRNFYWETLHQLGHTPRFYRGDAKRQLQKALADLVEDRKTPVIIVDEAHLLSKEMLEEIRFLLNLHMDSRSSLALIIAGQTELKDRLKLQIHQAIAGRVDLRFHLGPLTAEETARYVRSHLEAVKSPGEIFTKAAVAMLYEYSGGIPRKINKVATACLMSAACSQSRLVDDHMVRVVVASEFEI